MTFTSEELELLMQHPELMTLEDYATLIGSPQLFPADWRIGQTAFNVLASARPAIAEAVRGSLIDPFYDDQKLQAFMRAVETYWTD